MYVQIRFLNGSATETINTSRRTTVRELKAIIEEKKALPSQKQRLFYLGKELENEYELYHYGIGLNDVIQLALKPDIAEATSSSDGNHPPTQEKEYEEYEVATGSSDSESGTNSSDSESETPTEDVQSSNYYKVGDIVDAKDTVTGAWFEAKVLRIRKSVTPSDGAGCHSNANYHINDGYKHHVQFVFYDDEVVLGSGHLRPRTHYTYKFEELKVGITVLVNYNLDHPKERGHWYDMKITSINELRNSKRIVGTLFVGPDSTAIENCKVTSWNEIMRIETPTFLINHSEDARSDIQQAGPSRAYVPDCSSCKDDPRIICRKCSCFICGGKEEPEKQLLCDDCNDAYHIGCLDPPLQELPEDDYWYCPDCEINRNEIVGAGRELNNSRKKDAQSKVKRDWGRGMACIGRSKTCSLVTPHYYGPIPGIDVGTCWRYRIQVSEAGVHRPHVAGIHGCATGGAYSIVLANGYDDNIDRGNEVIFSGTGGRDLSGNKRTAKQTSDQVLERNNLALARSCHARLNNKTGAEAKDWKKGKPVRVVRSYKLKPYSRYAPQEGNRYDGIYKVCKYWPKKGKSGFLVWQFLLRRDDPSPAPWTREGKKCIRELGLDTVQYPEGNQEAMAGSSATKVSRKRTKKGANDSTPPTKMRKLPPYKLDEEILSLIDKDVNKKLWAECIETLKEGKQKFLEKVTESFQCVCCQDFVSKPTTTPCIHNTCQDCLMRSFASKIFECPLCRRELGNNYKIKVNVVLQNILKQLFPGYNTAR